MGADTASAFFVTGGTLRPDAPCYLERQADRDLFEALLKGEFCYVLTSRQMGKSSLMVRAAVKLRERGVDVVVLDLSAIGQNVDAEQWHNGLLAGIGRQLRLENELEEYWTTHSRLTPMQRLVSALCDVALARCRVSLVVFVDEIDVVRSLPFNTDEFFAAIRSCHNQRAENPEFRRLTFCLLGVATPSDLIQDPRITPFNIGRRIELHDFTAEEAVPLAKGLEFAAGNPSSAAAALERILHWTNGHPYLTQRLCKAVAAGEAGNTGRLGRRTAPHVDELCQELFLTDRARERDDNLVFVRERLLRIEADRAALLHLYQSVLDRPGPQDDGTNPLVGALRLSGIVRRDGDHLRVRNRIYASAFDHRWIEANMPDAEKRRQREAYQRGVMRTATVFAVVLLIMGGLIVLALRSRDQARYATWRALCDQARLSRLSGLPGQRFGALESIRSAMKIRMSPELRGEAIACLTSPDLRKEPAWPIADTNMLALVFADDFRKYAFTTTAGDIVVRSADGNGDLARWRTPGGPAARIWFAPDSLHVALADTNSEVATVSLWRSTPPETLFVLTNKTEFDAVDFSPDSRHVAIGGQDGTVRIYMLPEGKTSAEWEIEQPCTLVSYDPNGRWLAVASLESLTIRIFAASSGELFRTLHSASPPTHLAWGPEGLQLAAAGQDRRIRLWEIEADEFPKAELPPQLGAITALAFNHSGSLLASACADDNIRLWEPGSTRLLLTAPGAARVRQLKFRRDDRQLGFGLSGRDVSFWQVADGAECRTLFDFEGDDLSAVDVHPDGNLMATSHRNGVTFWDLDRGLRLARMSVGATSTVRFHSVSGDLVTGEFRGTYRFQVEQQTRGGEHFRRLKAKEDFYLGPGAKALALARDADVLAVAYDDRIRLVKDTNSAYGVLGEFVGQAGFSSVALSPDGRWVAAANWKSREAWLWDRATNGPPRRWNVGGNAYVSFSPDGNLLATGTEGAATLWDTQLLRPEVTVERPAGAVRSAVIAFARNRGIWAMAMTDSRVRILERNGNPIADLETPQKHSLVGMSFTPDGSRLVCATAARLVLVWNLGALAQGLREIGLDAGWSGALPDKPEGVAPMDLEVGTLNRLRFSSAQRILNLLREVGDLTDLIRRYPNDWNYRRHRAERYRHLGEFPKAVVDYQEWIKLDRTNAWPLRDLALIYLSAPKGVRDYKKAMALTEDAVRLEPENGDNHFRFGLACYRLERFADAETSFANARRQLALEKKNVTAALFYQAMCQARQSKYGTAVLSLELARQNYAQTDLKYRESHAEELTELLWEAERIVGETNPGG